MINNLNHKSIKVNCYICFKGCTDLLLDREESQPQDLGVCLSYDTKSQPVRRKSRIEWLRVLRVRWHRIPARSGNFPRFLPDSLAVENWRTIDENKRDRHGDVRRRSHETRVSRVVAIFLKDLTSIDGDYSPIVIVQSRTSAELLQTSCCLVQAG